jgi:predicted transcriptional regulator
MSKKDVKRIAEEANILDVMVQSLAEVLEEKGLITQEEWEQRIKKNLKG